MLRTNIPAQPPLGTVSVQRRRNLQRIRVHLCHGLESSVDFSYPTKVRLVIVSSLPRGLGKTVYTVTRSTLLNEPASKPAWMSSIVAFIRLGNPTAATW